MNIGKLVDNKRVAMGSNLGRADHESLSWLASEESAQNYFEKMRWPDGVRCPRCASKGRVRRLNGATTRLGAYKCYACRRIFSITHGTLFSASHVPVHKWLQAICLTEGGTKSMRPHHLQQILNVSFKTAASMVRRLADAAATDRDIEPRAAEPPRNMVLPPRHKAFTRPHASAAAQAGRPPDKERRTPGP